MNFKMGEITSKGHGLLAKVLAGTELVLSSVHCGDGDFEGDIWDLECLVKPKLQGAIISVTPKPQEKRTAVVIRFTNETVKQFFMLKEIGIYALDPDEGEILYAYANAGERANFVEEFSGQWYDENEITFYIYTASATNISAKIVKSSYADEISYDNTKSKLLAVNLQEAVDELSCCNLIDAVIYHNLDTYPNAVVFEIINGYGAIGYGQAGYGGLSEKREVKNRIIFNSRNSIQLQTEKKYEGVPEIKRINANEYIIKFETIRLYLLLISNFNDSRLNATDLQLDASIKSLSVKLDVVDANSNIRDNNLTIANSQLDTHIKSLSAKLDVVDSNSNIRDNNLTSANLQLDANIKNLSTELNNATNNLNTRDSGFDAEISNLKNTLNLLNAVVNKLENDIKNVPKGYGR